MHHVATPTPRRHHRARAAAIVVPAPRRARRPRLSSLDVVSLQVIVGFVAPLPLIELGHYLFGWASVTVMFGGQ